MADFVMYGFSEGTYSWRRFSNVNIGSADGEYGIPFSLLPTRLAPLDKQVQLSVNGTLYENYTGGQVPSNAYTLTEEETISSGIPCWGIRLVSTAVNTAQIAQIAAWDHNGDLIPLEATWFDTAQNGGYNAIMGGRLTDLDPDTHVLDSENIDIRFPRQYAVSKVGWTSGADGDTDDYADTMTISLNVGSWATESWSEMAADTDLDDTYPTMSDPIDVDEDMLYLEPSDGSLTEGGTIEPYFTLSTPLANPNDQIVMWRETKQSGMWAQPISGARFRGEDWYYTCKQILFVAQEFADLEGLIGAHNEHAEGMDEPDYTQGNQMALFLNHASTDTYSLDDIDLLQGIAAELENTADQLIVEQGDQTDGTSTVWTELTVVTEWTATEDEVTLAASSDLDLRIRRSTKQDALWFDSTDDPNNFTIGTIRLMAQQVTYLMQETVAMPFIDQNSILSNPHFPRRWNWLRYVWSGVNPKFGGPAFVGSSKVIIWQNNVKLVEGTDYEIVPFPWWSINWLITLTLGDLIDIWMLWDWGFDNTDYIWGATEDNPDDVTTTPEETPAESVTTVPQVLIPVTEDDDTGETGSTLILSDSSDID
ncbi:MAG: hypothetical protein ACXABF_14975, partial [Candidatus Thorarchaeota archaeon]